jgi:hypothetical protein
MLISNVSFSLKSLTDRVKDRLQVDGIIYNEDLDYETTIRHLRSIREREKINKPDLPVIIFNRENLRLDEESIARRGSGVAFKKEEHGISVDILQYCRGMYRVNFAYLTNNMLDFENKEIMLLSDRSLFNSFQIDVDALLSIEPNTFGKFRYMVMWDFADVSKQMVIENTYYKILQWSFNIKGVFCIFNIDKAPLITTIDLWLRDFWKTAGIEFKLEA